MTTILPPFEIYIFRLEKFEGSEEGYSREEKVFEKYYNVTLSSGQNTIDKINKKLGLKLTQKSKTVWEQYSSYYEVYILYRLTQLNAEVI